MAWDEAQMLQYLSHAVYGVASVLPYSAVACLGRLRLVGRRMETGPLALARMPGRLPFFPPRPTAGARA
eukprot:6118206-Pyramimonas_sp.AAC.1